MAPNNLNLTVPDVPRTQAFFETNFGFRRVAGGQTSAIVVLVDESGFALTLSLRHEATPSIPRGLDVLLPCAGGALWRFSTNRESNTGAARICLCMRNRPKWEREALEIASAALFLASNESSYTTSADLMDDSGVGQV